MEQPDTQPLTVEPTDETTVFEGAASASVSPSENDLMNAFFRSGMDASTSNPPSVDPSLAVDETPAAESASPEDVPAAGDPGSGAEPPAGRRSRRAAEDAARIAQLEAQLAERDPDKIREQLRSELANEQAQQAIGDAGRADAERYRRLCDTPDHQLSGEDYQWREDRKDLLARYPDVRKHYEGMVASERQAMATERDQVQRAFWADVYRQLEPTLALPGLSDEQKAQLKKASWSEQIQIHRAAERALVDHEMAALKKELEETKRSALASIRVPATPGTSSGSGGLASENEMMNGLFRSLALSGQPPSGS